MNPENASTKRNAIISTYLLAIWKPLHYILISINKKAANMNNTSNPVIPCDPLIHEVRAIIKGESRQLASKAHIKALLEFHDNAIPYFGRISSLLTEAMGQIANRDPDSPAIKRLLKCREDIDAVIKAATTKPTNPEGDTHER